MKRLSWLPLIGLVAAFDVGCNKDDATSPAGGDGIPSHNAAPTLADSRTNSSSLQFDKTVYDFGVVSLAESVSGKFIYKNAGREVLKLQPPEPECGCTTATVKPDTLQPGESGELSFTLALGNVRSHLEKKIKVISNDPVTPKMELVVRADYTPLYEIMPTMLRLEVRDGIETNVTLQATRTDGKNLNMKGFGSPTPWITADLADVGQSPTGLVKFKIKAQGVGASFANYVRIYSEDTNKPVASIFVVLRVLGDLTWNPEMLYWGITETTRKLPAEDLMTRRLVVMPTVPRQDFELFNPTSTFTNANLEVIPTEKGRKYEIVVRLSELPKKTTTGVLSFETSLTNQPKVLVPMSVKVVD